MWLKSKLVQKLGGGYLERFSLRTWSRLQFAAMNSRKGRDRIKIVRDVHNERRSLLSAFEAFTVYSIARAQAKRPGAFAEVGVYEGASTKLICEVKGDKRFHIFDTFEGLPPDSDKDLGVHTEGQYACSLESVQKYLEGYENLEFHKGIFPDSAVDVDEPEFAFAHFDVDLYEGTLACLEFFYPRMVPGGVMLSHDYDLLDGVSTAFHEFLADKPEELIEMPTTQCMVIKL